MCVGGGGGRGGVLKYIKLSADFIGWDAES